MTTDTYNPPHPSEGETAKLSYDFGYKEGQSGKVLWPDGIEDIFETFVKVDLDRGVISRWYSIGWSDAIKCIPGDPCYMSRDDRS